MTRLTNRIDVANGYSMTGNDQRSFYCEQETPEDFIWLDEVQEKYIKKQDSAE